MKLKKTEQQEYEELRASVIEALEGVNTALAKLREAREAFETFREDVSGRIDDFVGEKSERWQYSESGQAHLAWQEEWTEEICDEPEDLDADVREYPMEPEG